MPGVRAATPSDQDDVADVAFATAFFGSTATHFFPDRRLFADLWVAPYFSPAGCCPFVAENDRGVVGYIIGSCDSARFRRHMARWALRVLSRWPRGRYSDVIPSTRYLLRTWRYPTPHAPFDRYPAHLHINVLPTARGAGFGKGLLEAFLGCLADGGVRGVQLTTTTENEAALGLYRSLGFEVWERRRSRIWRPWLGRPTTRVVMVKDLG